MSEVVVTVEQGKLKGKTGTDYAGKVYYSFQGIPFAKPPLGKLRFKDPLPADPWEGTRDATEEGSACSQYDAFQNKTVGSEDCLFLNVYTPEIVETQERSLKPVMFWVHGGGFTMGSSTTDMYAPDYLLTGDVVLVTTNYRVGLLGFLKLDDPSLEVPGNAGLKDLVLALRWVKNNIKNFSGDPNNITIFGESAGSAAIQYLLLSPLTEGLFHKAILESGSVFNSWARGYHRSDQFAEALNLKSINEKEILETLQALPPEELLELQGNLEDELLVGRKRIYGPAPERPSSNALLPDEPRNIMLAGTYRKVPLIIGCCDGEGMLGLFLGGRVGRQPVHKDFEDFVPFTFELERGSEESKRIAQNIKEFYYKDKEPSLETLTSYIELETDFFFSHGVQKTVENVIQKSQQPVYFYRFCFDGERNFLKKMIQHSHKGACHGDELAYLFKFRMLPGDLEAGSPEELTMKRLVKLWTNFAKTGNPNSKEKDELLDIEWEAVGKDGLNYLNIDTDLSVGINPDAERMEFWDKLYENFSFAKFW